MINVIHWSYSVSNDRILALNNNNSIHHNSVFGAYNLHSCLEHSFSTLTTMGFDEKKNGNGKLEMFESQSYNV